MAQDTQAQKDTRPDQEAASPQDLAPNIPAEALMDDVGAFSEVDALRGQCEELQGRYMRALADAENSRKRADRDRREAEQYGGSRLARDLLPVYDNLKRGLETANEEARANATALIEGIEITLRELTQVMTKHNMRPIAPELGDMFDAKIHQAMFEAPLPGNAPGQIIQVMQEGFMLHDRLLRPAHVGVASKS